MGYFPFILYFSILSWLLIKTPFIKKLPVAAWVLILFFAVKVLAGFLYGWFFSKSPDYLQTADTWRMYNESLVETRWLKTKPWAFIADIFSPRYEKSNGVLAVTNSYWNDIRSVLVVKLMAILNLLTGSRYYVNLLFFEYLSFFGPVALCRLFLRHFPKKKWMIICGAFFFPSTLFWCSGFHREGLLLSVIGILAWMTNKLIKGDKLTVTHWVWLVFLLLCGFLLRNYVIIFFILWSIPWVVALRLPAYKWALFLGMGIIMTLIFFASSHISFLPNLPEYLAIRQQAFLDMPAESLVQPEPLAPTPGGYIDVLPEALINGFFQPFPNSGFKKMSYLPAMIETVLFICLLLYASIDYRNWNSEVRSVSSSRTTGAMIWFCLCFGATVCILIGYTVPFLGAIVRYKSVMWPFLVLPLLILIPTKKQILKKMRWKKSTSSNQ